MPEKTESGSSAERSVKQKEDAPMQAHPLFNYQLQITSYAAPVSQPRSSMALTTRSMATMYAASRM